MRVFLFLWSFFFRLFPCPMKTGLYPIGNPASDSPVLVTCNFYLTFLRLKKTLAGMDAWVVVADSAGVNVWCAAGGDEFNTRTVTAAVKTSRVKDKVRHNTIILPPLAAPGVVKKKVEKDTGFQAVWGPARMEDIPQFLARGMETDEAMRRVTWTLAERMDTAVGSLFPFYFFFGLLFLLIVPSLFINYLLAGAAAFSLFFLVVPWLPGKTGLRKIIFPEILLALWLLDTLVWDLSPWPGFPLDLILFMAMLLVCATELGGLAPNLPSDMDPFLARLGVDSIGNTKFAGTVRTDLLNGYRLLTLESRLCVGCGSCQAVCPVSVWAAREDGKAVLADKSRCVACRACLTQCPTKAITAQPAVP